MQHDLELAEGEFAIGRNATCQLSLDDPLVSRRHAVFHIAADEITLEDLGSRNGVLLNGQKIEGRVKVRPGDKVLIGSQELAVIQLPEQSVAPYASAPTGMMPRVTLNRMTPQTFDPDQSVTKVSYSTDASLDDLTSVRKLDRFRLLGSVAEKAFAMGRVEEAERVLAASLAEVMESSRGGKVVLLPLAEQAARFAAKLATVTGKGAWVDYAVEIYATLDRPAPAVVIDELYAAFRKVSSADIPRLKAYVGGLRAQLPEFGPADRFLFQRIEGLERLATLRS